MDGFAVRAADLAGREPRMCRCELDVVAHIAAGDFWEGEVGPGQAARIMTGAPVPAGADSVVMVERTRAVTGDGGIGSTVAFELEPRLGEHIRRRGEEVLAGDVVVSAGEVIGPAAIGLLACDRARHRGGLPTPARGACSRPAASSSRSPRSPGPGKIRNSNSYSIAAQVVAAGGVPVRYGIVPDDMEATRAAFAKRAPRSATSSSRAAASRWATSTS